MNRLDRGFRCARCLHTDTKHRFTCLRLPDDLKPVNSKASRKAGAIACCAVLLSFIMVLAGCGGGSSSSSPTPAPTPTPDGSFAPAASLPTMNQGRDSATATLLPNGKVLVAGGRTLGHTGSIVSLASVELYDPATNTFAPPGSTPTMNQSRASATATLLPSGKVLIAGGDSIPGDGAVITLTSVELYDPATNTFAPPGPTPSMNQARATFGGNTNVVAVLLSNGKVLIAGGVDPSDVGFDTVELYDPTTNTFAPAASLPTMNGHRDEPVGTSLPNGEALIAGGFERFLGTASIISDTIDLYDPVTNSFAPAASTPTMNSPRSNAAAALLPNGTVLIAGGTAPAPEGPGGVALASVDLYDSATNSFAPPAATPAMNEPRCCGPTATLLQNGKVLITQGEGDNTVDLYDPTTNTFAPAALLPKMNQTRVQATATLLPNGKVLIAGGGALLNTIELYTP
jgi:Kelch motif